MKVFAEFIEENGVTYRKTTLLQIGESWELIGSAVLKNPGSSKPLNPISDESYNQIENLYSKTKLEKSNWFDFSVDSTMGFLEKLFNGTYAENGQKRELNGVIQLFNLFYINDPDIKSANAKSLNNTSKHLVIDADSTIKMFKDKPVFIGWRFEYVKNNDRKIQAEMIFDFVSKSKNMYLKPLMIDNNFYHPIYINRASKTNHDLKVTLNNFNELFDI
jgi:hypothetical protein